MDRSNGDRNLELSSSPMASSRNPNKDGHEQEQEEDSSKSYTVPFYKLFAFADSKDVVLMLLGTVGSIANGAALPFMTVLFGNLIDAFGGALSLHEVVNRVAKVIFIPLSYLQLAFSIEIYIFLVVLVCKKR
jgi:ATP-binding cassette, subfamily B (MDR/TAP), member 1